MTKFLGLCTGALALVLATPASAQTVTLRTTMNGGEEVPVINTGMVGTAEVSVDVANRGQRSTKQTSWLSPGLNEIRQIVARRPSGCRTRFRVRAGSDQGQSRSDIGLTPA